MSLTENKVVDQIMVTESGIVLYREATTIMRGEEQVAKKYHRTTLMPGQDLTGHPANVVAVAQAAWTPEVVSAYQQAMDEAAQRVGGQA